MTLKELRVKRAKFVGKWVPKPDQKWISMMKKRAKKKQRKALEELELARKLLAGGEAEEGK